MTSAGTSASVTTRNIRRQTKDAHRRSRLRARTFRSEKSGLGWYRYEAGRRDAIPDPVVDKIIVEERKALKIEPRKIADAEIVDRLLYALVNEGAHILEEGIAQRASDIDVVYLAGYGFPVQRGGPMFYAGRVGLGVVVRRMKEFATNKHADPEFWKPAKLITQLAAEDRPSKTRQ